MAEPKVPPNQSAWAEHGPAPEPVPPNQAAWAKHGPPPERPQPFRSAATRARLAMLLLGGMAAINAVGIALDLTGLRLMDRIAQGSITMAQADAYDQQRYLYTIAWFAIFTPTVIAFLAWVSRAVANVPALGQGETTSSPRAAIIWWFVPLINLVKPYAIVNDLHDRLGPPRSRPDPIFPILVWWGVWWVANAVENYADRLYAGGIDVETLRDALTFSIIGNALSILAAILAILVIRAIQTREDDLAARQASVSPNAVPVAAG